MWRADRSNLSPKKMLILAEIIIITVLMIAFGAFIWKNAKIDHIDTLLQVMFVGAFLLVIVLTTNFVLNRRW
jgi:Na+/proline symporter